MPRNLCLSGFWLNQILGSISTERSKCTHTKSPAFAIQSLATDPASDPTEVTPHRPVGFAVLSDLAGQDWCGHRHADHRDERLRLARHHAPEPGALRSALPSSQSHHGDCTDDQQPSGVALVHIRGVAHRLPQGLRQPGRDGEERAAQGPVHRDGVRIPSEKGGSSEALVLGRHWAGHCRKPAWILAGSSNGDVALTRFALMLT